MAFVPAGMARADTASVGVTVNGTTGAHIEPYQSESIPFLPLPTIEIDATHKRLEAHLEVMPPIGPVPLAQGEGGFLQPFSPDPRISYVSGELRYRLWDDRYAFGVGETILNQLTHYSSIDDVTASRVVGMRLYAGGLLYRRDGRRLEASIAVSPSMQGQQAGYLPERASLTDSSLRWSVDEGKYVFAYGIRYVNYTAEYTDRDELADRNHLFMPFVAVDVPLGRHADPVRYHAQQPVAPSARAPQLRAGVSLLGTNGDREVYDSGTSTTLPFSLAPLFSLSRIERRWQLQAEAIAPNDSSNPFGALGQRWSYADVDALADVDNGDRYALGVGEAVVNLREASPPPYERTWGHSEGLHGIATMRISRDRRGETDARISVAPYLHVRNLTQIDFPGERAFSVGAALHGARVDASLGRTLHAGAYDFSYGLRYINQTTDYGRIDSFSKTNTGLELTRSSSLMPFVGVSAPL